MRAGLHIVNAASGVVREAASLPVTQDVVKGLALAWNPSGTKVALADTDDVVLRIIDATKNAGVEHEVFLDANSTVRHIIWAK